MTLTISKLVLRYSLNYTTVDDNFRFSVESTVPSSVTVAATVTLDGTVDSTENPES